jgi:hypothetical protein
MIKLVEDIIIMCVFPFHFRAGGGGYGSKSGMCTSVHLRAGQNHDIKAADTLSENVPKFRYSGTAVTESRLNSGNAFYKNLMSFRLLSRNIKYNYKNTFPLYFFVRESLWYQVMIILGLDIWT